MDLWQISNGEKSLVLARYITNIHVVELSTLYAKTQHNDNIICGAPY